jgi:hypothetical protein
MHFLQSGTVAKKYYGSSSKKRYNTEISSDDVENCGDEEEEQAAWAKFLTSAKSDASIHKFR